MLIFLQELIILLFLWGLRLCDGLVSMFSSLIGLTPLTLGGEEVYLLSLTLGNEDYFSLFLGILVLSFGLVFLFGIVALIKNMTSAKEEPKEILTKVFHSIFQTILSISFLLLFVLLSGDLLTHLATILDFSGGTSLSHVLFDSCVGDYLNGYSGYEIDVTTVSVKELMGNYSSAVFGIWPEGYLYDGMINPETFRYLPALISCGTLLFSLLASALSICKRLFELAYLLFLSPISLSLYPLDNGGAYKRFEGEFLNKLLMSFGMLISLRLYILFIPYFSSLEIPGGSKTINSLLTLFLLVGGSLILPVGQTLIGKILVGTPTDPPATKEITRAFRTLTHTISHISHDVMHLTKSVTSSISKANAGKVQKSSVKGGEGKYTNKERSVVKDQESQKNSMESTTPIQPEYRERAPEGSKLRFVEQPKEPPKAKEYPKDTRGALYPVPDHMESLVVGETKDSEDTYYSPPLAYSGEYLEEELQTFMEGYESE